MEGFDFTLSVIGWGEDQEEMQRRILALFPESRKPSEQGFSVRIVKVKRLTHKGKP